MPSPSEYYGRPLSAFRVLVQTADEQVGAALLRLLTAAGFDVSQVLAGGMAPHRRFDLAVIQGSDEAMAPCRAVLRLVDSAPAADDLILPESTDDPGFARLLAARVRQFWHQQCLEEEACYYRVVWEEAVRERRTAETQVDRSERSLLASYRELQTKHEALTAQNEALQAALEAEAKSRAVAEEREKLLMQVVHDQRTDLMNIALAADLARHGAGGGDHFDSIRESLARIDRFLEDKIHRLKENRQTRYAHLAATMTTIARCLAGQLAQANQRLEMQLPAVDVTVPLSPIELEQVGINLLHNAMKFAPTGSAIGFIAEVTAQGTRLRVVDEGPGIPPAMLQAIGSGRRADSAVPGNGLGLRNVQALLERVGGCLQWHNGERGAVFEAVLPLVPDEPLLG